MAITYINQSEQDYIRNATGSTLYSLSDLRKLFYTQGTLGLLSNNDGIRAYLQSQTGSTLFSIVDLWRLFLVSEGIANQVSLGDMLKEYWTTESTSRILLETGDFLIQETGENIILG